MMTPKEINGETNSHSPRGIPDWLNLYRFVYFGILAWAQGWDYASSQFVRDRWYVIPIILGFGVQAALYSILRFRLFIPVTSTATQEPSWARVEAHPPLRWSRVAFTMSPMFYQFLV